MDGYTIHIDEKRPGHKERDVLVSKEVAEVIWSGYRKANPYERQTMDQRQARGGIAWLSEIRYWQKAGFLTLEVDIIGVGQ